MGRLTYARNISCLTSHPSVTLRLEFILRGGGYFVLIRQVSAAKVENAKEDTFYKCDSTRG